MRRVYIWRTPKEAYNPEGLVPTVHHGRITAREFMDRLGNQVHPMTQTIFPNNDAVFQDQFEEHEGELQHLS
jgi:hypothetical protein